MAGLRSFLVALVVSHTLLRHPACYPDCIKRCHNLDCIDYCLSHPSVPLSEDKVTKEGAHVGGRKAAALMPRA
ncbi:hypothetical protein QJS10_CPB22g01300 [Acorus calamus]|uniref:Uncharacterized protein n=1 Tax=Acorus calamus TaxID=4465 RepID=A0AAV9C2J0_ACOCL|nr:hypothetical protein QJS10_CPB22g01300 [Acorus calamus]